MKLQHCVSKEINYSENQKIFTLFTELIKNALPYTLTSFIGIGGNFLGVVFVSHLGPVTLAACNLTSSIQNWFNSSIGTAVLAVTNSAGQIKGSIDKDYADGNVEAAASKYPKIGQCLHDSWAFSLLLSIPPISFMLICKPILLMFKQNTEVVDLSKQYFYSYVFGLPAMYMMSCNRKITLAVGEPSVGLVFNIFYQLTDTALSYALVYGKYGLPKLGLPGLGYSNTVTAWSSFILFTAYILFSNRFRSYKISNFNFTNFWSRVWTQAKLGLPLGAKVSAELGSLLAASLMIGAMNTDEQAAQEISYQYVFVSSTLMFGIFDTVISQVPRAVKARNLSNAKKIGNIGIGLSVVLAIIGLAIFTIMPKILLRAFINTDNSVNLNVIGTACSLMLVNAITQVFDSIRNISLASLNGFTNKDRMMSTLYIILTVGLINLPLSYLFGFPLGMSAVGVMIAREYSIGIGALILFYSWMMKDSLPSTQTNQSNSLIEKIPTDHTNSETVDNMNGEETLLITTNKQSNIRQSNWASFFSFSKPTTVQNIISSNKSVKSEKSCSMM